MPGLALGHAVAHGGHAARHLRRAARLARRLRISSRIGLEGLMRREHVVVGGDDAEVGRRSPLRSASLSCGPQAAKPWARLAQPSALRFGVLADGRVDLVEIAPRAAAVLRAMIVSVTAEIGLVHGHRMHLLLRGTSRASRVSALRSTARTGMSSAGPSASACFEHLPSFRRLRCAAQAVLAASSTGSVKVRRGSPAPGAVICDQRACGIGVERFGQPVAAGEEGGRVAVVAHAEHGHVEGRQRFAASRVVRSSGTNVAAAALFCSRCSRTSRALERSLVSGTWRSSTSVTVTRLPWQCRCCDSFSKNSFGVVPPETASVALPLASMARVELVGHVAGQAFRPAPRGRRKCVRLRS